MKRVTVAVSGGVDSAVAMRLLQEDGYAVEACHLLLCKDKPEDAVGALCEAMGVKLRVLDLRAEFECEVVAPFYAAYARGETPNPCAFCNPRIKFGALSEHVRGVIATGHYAELATEPESGVRTLRKNVDTTKDQSYFLYALTSEILERTLFPLAGKTRAEVVAIAKEQRLPIPEQRLASGSQDICFLPEGDYRAGLAARHPESQRSGDILNSEGKVIGRHTGLGNYTRGQRRGIGVATGGRAFVTGFDRVANTLTLGPKEDLYVRSFKVTAQNWLVPPRFPLRCQAVSRYHHPPFDCTVYADGRVEADAAQYLVTPGQACVFYRGAYLLGGGVIDNA